MMTGASHSVAQYRVTEPMKKRVTAVLFCFMRISASGLACIGNGWDLIAKSQACCIAMVPGVL